MAKRILVIGNGFDIAHGYLTSYFDFLYACCLVNGRDFNGKDYDAKKFNIEVDIKNAFYPIKDKICSNRWINYFLDVIEDLKPTWIDFEREIKNICSYYCRLQANFDKKCIYRGKRYTISCKSLLSDNKFNFDILKKELEELINILNIYLSVATSKLNKGYLEEIFEFIPDYVVNFNYTDTFEKTYNKYVKVDYVHGKLDIENNSIVLGIDSMKDEREDIEFAEFIKYFQMINKKVNINIFDKVHNNKFDKLMILGHSLDITDSDILLKLINQAEKVTIVCHDSKAKSDKIKKLMEMIDDRETFINYNFKSNNKITFVQQSAKILNDDKYGKNKQFYEIISNGRIESEKDVVFLMNYLIQYGNNLEKDIFDNSVDSINEFFHWSENVKLELTVVEKFLKYIKVKTERVYWYNIWDYVKSKREIMKYNIKIK